MTVFLVSCDSHYSTALPRGDAGLQRRVIVIFPDHTCTRSFVVLNCTTYLLTLNGIMRLRLFLSFLGETRDWR